MPVYSACGHSSCAAFHISPVRKAEVEEPSSLHGIATENVTTTDPPAYVIPVLKALVDGPPERCQGDHAVTRAVQRRPDQLGHPGIQDDLPAAPVANVQDAREVTDDYKARFQGLRPLESILMPQPVPAEAD